MIALIIPTLRHLFQCSTQTPAMISWTKLSRNLDEAFRGVSITMAALSSRTARKEILAITVNDVEGLESTERLLILIIIKITAVIDEDPVCLADLPKLGFGIGPEKVTTSYK